MHPEYSLIALLLPGSVFCCLMFLEWCRTGDAPLIRLFGWTFPVWLVYVVVFLTGWFWLGMLAVQSIRRGLKS